MKLKATLSQAWDSIQGSLFPWIEEELPALSEKQQQLVAILELVRIEEFVQSCCSGYRGRPLKCRSSIARAFIAKAVYNIPTTKMLIERLQSDISLRRICGWEYRKGIPSESVFSRAFAGFSSSQLPMNVHKALIEGSYTEEIVGHVITDASAIEARETPAKKKKETPSKGTKKIGRPVKGQEKPKQVTRIQKQASGQMTLEEMLDDLPKQCDIGGKTNSKGHLHYWIGYKIHVSVDDHGVPLAGIITSASIHDSQVAIPLAKLTAQRVTSFYDLMDSAYDVSYIIDHSLALGHVPIIEHKTCRGKKEEEDLQQKACRLLNFKPAEAIRYEARPTVERTFSRLKDGFGFRFLMVKGIGKVTTHLMFGILALAADQLLRIVV